MPKSKVTDSKLVGNLRFRVLVEKAKVTELKKDLRQAKKKKTRTPSAWSTELGRLVRSGKYANVYDAARALKYKGVGNKHLPPPRIHLPKRN